MAIFITGVAGFIGCNLAEHFVRQGKTVFGVDNFSRGNLSNLSRVIDSDLFTFAEIKIDEPAEFEEFFAQAHAREPISEVWHLAANSDIAAGVAEADVDLRDTFMTTYNTLQAMKKFKVPSLLFASSSAIYGDLGVAPLVESIGPLIPISNYGAMKLASEAIICAAAESYLESVFIFRFPNVIGVPATHGVMLDFVRKLRKTPGSLSVLGDGSQQKGYLHVEDLLDAMFFIQKNSTEKVSIFNIGAGDDGVTVRSIAEQTVQVTSPSAEIKYGTGNKGWVGDVPRFTYSVEKLNRLGWMPKFSSQEAVRKALLQILEQETQSS